MKRFFSIVALCALFSIAAFGVLVTADRGLGLALPYSIPLSFTIVTIVAPAVYAVANAVRRWQPVVVRTRPSPPPAPRLSDAAAAHRRIEGVVLLDFSNAVRLHGRAA